MSNVRTPQKRQANIKAWHVEADELDRAADVLIREGMCDYTATIREKAVKLRKRAVNSEAGMASLKALLAEFRTQVLPGMGCDGSVQLP